MALPVGGHFGRCLGDVIAKNGGNWRNPGSSRGAGQVVVVILFSNKFTIL